MYTKGKWKLMPARNRHYLGGEIYVYEQQIQRCYYICGPKHNSHFVADIIVSTEKEGLANAHLIAAAPALLEACKDYITWFEKLSRYQNQRLGHGLKEACQTWGEASTVELFDCSKMKAAVAKAEQE